MDFLDEIAQQCDCFLFHQLFVFGREQGGAGCQIVHVFVVILLDGPQAVHYPVAAFFHFHLDTLDNPHEVARLESLVHLVDEVVDVGFRGCKHTGIHTDALEYIGVLVVDALDEFADTVFVDEVLQVFGETGVFPVLVQFGLELEGIVFAEMTDKRVDMLVQLLLQVIELFVQLGQFFYQFGTTAGSR